MRLLLAALLLTIGGAFAAPQFAPGPPRCLVAVIPVTVVVEGQVVTLARCTDYEQTVIDTAKTDSTGQK